MRSRLMLASLTVLIILALVGCTGPTAAPTSVPQPTVIATAIPTVPPTVVAEPTAAPSPTATPQATAAVANPASTYCVEHGGTVDIRGGQNGQVGYCVFPNGSECEEWAYFRGECKPAATSVNTDTLLAEFQATLPPEAFEGVAALELEVPAGQPSLWAVHTYGLRNYDIEPVPSHIVALYTYDGAKWQSVARAELERTDEEGMPVMGPDFVGEGGVAQPKIDPSRVFLEVSGGAGAHSGTFQLLSYDGKELKFEVSLSAASPGFGRVQDVNGDGIPDVVLDVSDKYVFCYACGVRKIMYEVWAWDESAAEMREVTLRPVPESQSGNPARAATNRAVQLAEAGLWKQAMAEITKAKETVGLSSQSAHYDPVIWDYSLIKLHADEMRKSVTEDAYPLLANVFYGDYAAAVDIMRPYAPDEIFTTQSPLIVGTAAERWEPEISKTLIEATSAALEVEPNLAGAYFLRGWGRFLAGGDAEPAKADVAKAAELAPSDTLFAKSRDYLAEQ